MTVGRDAVVYGFKLILGRTPDSEAAIQAHMKCRDETALAETLFRSLEFQVGGRFKNILSTKSVDEVTQRGNPDFLFIGNCQTRGLANLFEAMLPGAIAQHFELSKKNISEFVEGKASISSSFENLKLIFCQFGVEHPFYRTILDKYPDASKKIRHFPSVAFRAFQPDCEYITDNSGALICGPLGQYQSALIFNCWNLGVPVEKVSSYFCSDIFRQLGYFDYFRASKDLLINQASVFGVDFRGCFDKWVKCGSFMHSMNHPKVNVLADLAKLLIKNEGLCVNEGVESYIEDSLSFDNCWPVYPEIADSFGFSGGYYFKPAHIKSAHPKLLNLEEFISASYKLYNRYSRGELKCFSADGDLFARVISGRGINKADVVVSSTAKEVESRKSSVNPYKGLPDYNFWRKSIEMIECSSVDPVVSGKFKIGKFDKVATAGSCFAQHISKTLQKRGFNYFVPERLVNASEEEGISRNYGVFSARFGNLYTAKQLVQLMDRAYGAFLPADEYWTRPDGKFVDPFRPQIEANGFDSAAEVIASRRDHLAYVRSMFQELDYFVFTLGLTESWRNKIDGAVFPLAPGVAGGELDHDRYEFVNFGVDDVVKDLQRFIDKLQVINPKAKIILTVSPVPLVATYEDRHVLVSTTYSKSALRAAAEEIVDANSHCAYFPSYEIITGNFNHGAYYDNDLRSVKPEGVEHVMKLFMSHYSEGGTQETVSSRVARENSAISGVICDEEAIDR